MQGNEDLAELYNLWEGVWELEWKCPGIWPVVNSTEKDVEPLMNTSPVPNLSCRYEVPPQCFQAIEQDSRQTYSRHQARRAAPVHVNHRAWTSRDQDNHTALHYHMPLPVFAPMQKQASSTFLLLSRESQQEWKWGGGLAVSRLPQGRESMFPTLCRKHVLSWFATYSKSYYMPCEYARLCNPSHDILSNIEKKIHSQHMSTKG